MMKPSGNTTPPDNLRSAGAPHATTQDQINEMESEGQGGTTKKDPKPKSYPPPNRTTKTSIPARWKK
jgi:hypothetical protein